MLNIGYFEGYCDNGEVNYCPMCGAEIKTKIANGSSDCEQCGTRFAVFEIVGKEREAKDE